MKDVGPALARPLDVMALGFILSIAIGLTLGLLGGGGSTLTVPLLHYAFGIGAHDAIATSLLVVAMTSAVALIPQRAHVQWHLGLTFGLASMLTAYVGGRLGALLPGTVLIVAFAGVMVAAGIAMLLRCASTPGPALRIPRPSRMLAIGLGVGLLTGVLGAGGGFLVVPALALWGGLAMREAVATSLLVIVLNALAGAAGSVPSANVDLDIAAGVTALAIVGSLVGVRLGRRLTGGQLRYTFAWFIIIVAVMMLAYELTRGGWS